MLSSDKRLSISGMWKSAGHLKSLSKLLETPKSTLKVAPIQKAGCTVPYPTNPSPPHGRIPVIGITENFFRKVAGTNKQMVKNNDSFG